MRGHLLSSTIFNIMEDMSNQPAFCSGLLEWSRKRNMCGASYEASSQFVSLPVSHPAFPCCFLINEQKMCEYISLYIDIRSKGRKHCQKKTPLLFLINRIAIFNRSFLQCCRENKSFQEICIILWIELLNVFCCATENNWSLSSSNDSDLLHKALRSLFMKSAT